MTKTQLRNWALTAAFLVGLAAASGYGAPSHSEVNASNAAHSLPACATEDSDNCYWDAATRSNGQGHSFFVISGHVTYTN